MASASIGVGALLGKKLLENVITWGAATLFALFGVLLVVEGVRGLG